MQICIDVLPIVVFLALCRINDAATANDVERLFQDKLKKSNPKIRPVWNQSHAVDIVFTVHLIAVTDLIEVQQKIEATIYLEVQWQNELLAWNKSDYGELDFINPNAATIWRPDLSLANGYNELNPIGMEYVNMGLAYTGLTIWLPGKKVEFLCNIDVTKFPFDTQDCYMAFFNWGGTKDKTTLNYNPSPNDSDIEAIYPNSEWSIIDRKIVKETDKPYDIVRVHLILKRKSISLVLTVLLPVFLLSFLNVFVFLLPTESGEKLSFSVTVLLSQAVFLSFISGFMPQTSDSISGLSMYISTQLILSTFYILLTCCILRLYYRDTTEHPLPSWFLTTLCIYDKNNVYPLKDGGNKKLTFDNLKTSGVTISRRIDWVCFCIFLVLVVCMTSYYIIDGLTH